MSAPKFLSALNTGKGMDEGIKWVRTTGQKFDQYVHLIAVAIVSHAKDSGDCSRALRLVEAMPRSARRAALIRWFTAFSPISVTFHNDVKKRRVGLRKPDMKNFNEFNIEGATANPYYEWDKSEDNALAALLGIGDFNEKIISLADRIEKNITDGKVKPEDSDALAAKVKALRLVTVVTADAA